MGGNKIYHRYYGNELFRANSKVDSFSIKKEAKRKADGYRQSGYKARIAVMHSDLEDGIIKVSKKWYLVYHTTHRGGKG